MTKSSRSLSREALSGLPRERLEELFLSQLSTELEERNEARESLIAFTTYTKEDYEVSRIHQLIARELEDVIAGKTRRLIICLPPSSGKSELFSRRLPAFFLGRNPSKKVISASYNGDLASGFGRDVRNLVASKAYQRLFPGTTLSEDSQSKDMWHTSQGGGYVAVGVGGGLTGFHGHLRLIDDPFKGRAEAESLVQRDAVWDWYRSVFYTRGQDVSNDPIVVGCTRWHEDDLVGRLDSAEAEGTGDRWKRVIVPALTPEGGSFCPERFPTKELLRIREVIGPYDWASLYEQRPRPAGGSFFSERNLLDTEGKPVPFPLRTDTIFAVIDTAVKTGKEHDGLGVTYYALSKLQEIPLVILDWDLKQVEGAMLEAWLPTVFKYLETLAKECKARLGVAGVWIEDKASGMVLLQQANKHDDWKVHPIPSELSAIGKSERAINISGYVYSGKVKISQRAFDRVATYKGHTRNHLLSQILTFRAGSKDMGEDDLFDTFNYGVALALGGKGGF